MCLDTVTNMNETLNTITGYNSDAAIDLGYEKNVHNCYFHNCYLPISSNLLKKSFSKSSLFVLPRQLLWEKCSVSCIFPAIIVIVVIKTLEIYLLRNSVLEMNV